VFIVTARDAPTISCMRWISRAFQAVVLTGVLLMPSLGQAQEEVDVEIILAVDVSLSMSPTELEIQRRGYAEALQHETVLKAIHDGVYGRIALAYFEWAGSFSQRVVVPWTSISSAEDAKKVADRLSVDPSNSARRTSISGALYFASDLFTESPYKGLRRVLDISGDGPNNQGRPVADARDKLVNNGITINGLPLMTSSGYSSSYDVEELDVYYSECVVGGPGAFTIPVNDWSQFAEAVRRKLVIELADNGMDLGEAKVIRVQARALYDCLVGEKRWQGRMLQWQQ